MELNNNLKNLANEFSLQGYTLYIVGGYVRNELLGLNHTDIDITSNMPYDDVIKLCKKNKYQIVEVSKNLGTLQISKDNETYEYTQFRKDSYGTSGEHSPSKVTFVDDIETDAQRRDLKVNAIYYDIKNDKFVDPLNGVKEIKSKIISSASAPDTTLRDDGLRILRVLRFAIEYNFRIDKKTMSALKIFAGNLKNISKERIKKELEKIIIADLEHNSNNRKLFRYIEKLDLLRYIFNHSFSRAERYSRADKDLFWKAQKEARLVTFYFLTLKNYLKGKTSNDHLSFTTNMMLGLDGIKESNNNIKLVEKLYRIYQNIEYNVDAMTASINYLTLSNNERDIVYDTLSVKATKRLNDNIKVVRDKNLPLSIHQLAIGGEDLINAGINSRYVSKILSTLYSAVLNITLPNEKEALIDYALNLNDTLKTIAKDLDKNTKIFKNN